MKDTAQLFDYDRASRLMREEGLDVIVASRRFNVAYFTGVTNIVYWEYPDVAQILEMQEDGCPRADYFAGIPREQSVPPFVVCHRVYEMKRSWITDVRGWCFQGTKTGAADELAAALKERGLQNGVIGIDMDYFPAGRLDELRKLLPAATFKPADALIWKLRAMKTPEELRRQRKAFDVANEVYRTLVKTVKDGMTVNEARAIEMSVQIKEGISPQIFGYVMPSHNSTGIKRMPFSRKEDLGELVLKKGDLIVCDLGVVYRGYTTDFGRMLSIGEPDAKTRKAYRVVLDARAALIEALRPGMKISELFEIGRNALVKHGCAPDAIVYAGHGIGLECHESPAIVATDHTVIEEGMTLVIELCPAVDGIWFLLENTGLVTRDGWQSLTDFPTDILVAGE